MVHELKIAFMSHKLRPKSRSRHRKTSSSGHDFEPISPFSALVSRNIFQALFVWSFLESIIWKFEIITSLERVSWFVCFEIRRLETWFSRFKSEIYRSEFGTSRFCFWISTSEHELSSLRSENGFLRSHFQRSENERSGNQTYMNRL